MINDNVTIVVFVSKLQIAIIIIMSLLKGLKVTLELSFSFKLTFNKSIACFDEP